MSGVVYIYTGPGVLKFLTIVVGAVAYGLGVYSYDETTVQEEFFLRTVQSVLIISLIYFSVYLIIPEKLTASEMNQAVDIGFHLTASITLLVAGSLVIYSAVDNERTYCEIIYAIFPQHFCQFYGAKMAAGIVTLLNGTIYGVVAPAIFFTRRSNPTFQKQPRVFYFGTR